jgi:hypothetical protein
MNEIGEGELLGAAQAGDVLDGGENGAPRLVSSILIRRLCQRLTARVDAHGIRLKNVLIAGELDLAGLAVPFALKFVSCEFSEPLVIEGAELHDLALRGCQRLPGLLGNGVRIRRDLDLSHSRVSGEHETRASTSGTAAVWLCESAIGGRFLCVGTVIDSKGTRALQADRMTVGGTARLSDGFTASGTVRMVGSQIGGTLDLAGATIESATGQAVSLNDAAISGSLFLIPDPAGRPTVIRGRVDLLGARVSGQFMLRDAVLETTAITPNDVRHPAAREVQAIRAPRITVGGEMTLEGNCRITGSVDLSMSDASSIHIGGTSVLRADGGTAFDLTNAELRSDLTLSAGSSVHGTVRIAGSHIRGNLSALGTMTGSHDPASGFNTVIAAEGIAVDGDVYLMNVQASGGALRFRNAAIGGLVHADGAQLAHPGGYTLNLHQATVKGSVRMGKGFRSQGTVVLNRCVIEGRLECDDGQFEGSPMPQSPQRDHAIEAISATVRGGMDLGWESASPSVDFTNATTTFLADSPGNWPDRFTIAGFSYDRFQGSGQADDRSTWDVGGRCKWLSRQTPFDSGPYEQAALVFRQHGYTSQAEVILINQRRRINSITTSRSRRLLGALYGTSVGYGYRPWRVLWFLVLLLILVTVSLEIPATRAAMRAADASGTVYTTLGPLPSQPADAVGVPPAASASDDPSDPRADACGNGQVRCLSPALYAIDTVIPLISLDQRTTWYSDPHASYGTLMEWWLNIAAMLGWLLSSIFVLSFARLSRSSLQLQAKTTPAQTR